MADGWGLAYVIRMIGFDVKLANSFLPSPCQISYASATQLPLATSDTSDSVYLMSLAVRELMNFLYRDRGLAERKKFTICLVIISSSLSVLAVIIGFNFVLHSSCSI